MKTVPLTLDSTALHAIGHQAGLQPDKPAVQSGNISISFKELADLLDAFGCFLKEKNIDRNDKVVVMLPRGIQMALVSLGLMRNTVCVPLNPDFTSNELDHLLEMIDPQMILTNEQLSANFDRCKNISEYVALVRVALDPASKLWRFEGKEVTNGPQTQSRSLPKPDDIALMLLTSGSTSTPKLVPLSHKNISVSTHNLVCSLNLTEDDSCLNAMPMFHVGGLLDLLITPLSIGSSVKIASDMGSKGFFESLSKFDPTWCQAVPTMLLDIINFAEINNHTMGDSSLRLIRAVSSPLPAELKVKVEEFFRVPVIEIYGMTETAGVITSNPLPPEERKSHSVGKVIGATEVRIIDSQNNPVAANTSGEVIVSGDAVFNRYEQDGERNKDYFIGNWFKTGDTGLIDSDGYLFLQGRLKDIINRGGEKIAPLEIDRVIQSFPGVAEAAAFGTDHPSLGEEVAAAIVIEKAGGVDEKELRDHLARHLAEYKRPRILIYPKQLPRNSGGKIQRHLLKEYLNGSRQPSGEFSDLPETELEKVMAQLWRKVLNVKRVGRHDDFFERGGDSLRAALFIAQLEQRIEHDVDAKLIYEFPVLIDFATHLEKKPWFKSDIKRSQKEALNEELKRLMALWPGKRLSEDSLIVGHNVIGSKTPIYWCTNSLDHFVEQIKHFDADQPVFGMVTLLESKFRSAENNARAAKLYAEEILKWSPNEEIIIGAWCEGAKIMIDTANKVSERGIDVKLLFMQDNFIPKPYSKPVAFFFSSYAMNRFRNQYCNPDFGISKYYTGGFTTHYDDIDHTAYYQDPETIKQFAIDLTKRIDSLGEISSQPECAGGVANPQILNHEDYKAKLVIKKPPLYFRRGEQKSVEVELENKSRTTWQPSNVSGVILMVTWLDHSYSILGKKRVAFSNEIKPGEFMTIRVELEAPALRKRLKILFLQIDVVDDGVARFASCTSKAVRFPSLNATLMLWPVFIADNTKSLNWMEKALWYKQMKSKSLPVLATNSTIKLFRKLRDITKKYTN